MMENNQIAKMNSKEKIEKAKELRLELIKKYSPSQKTSKLKTKEIKKAIARILTSLHAPVKNEEKKN
ncbi:MAG: hypothetical protein AABX65_00595 [Nanoarchaeota archaeon]